MPTKESPLFDVAIIGYGPVGAVLANLLGKGGLSVVVIDQMVDIYDRPRAINIDHEVMRSLQSVGLADAVLAISSLHTGTQFRGCNDRLIKVFSRPEPPYPLAWPPNLMFIQPEFESILRGGASRYPTVDIRLGHKVTSLQDRFDDVSLQITRLDSVENYELRSKYVVACDGAASGVRKQLGISQESLDFDEWWTVIDAWAKNPSALPATTTHYCWPSGPCTYVVGPRTLRRWEMKVLPHEDPATHAEHSSVRRRLAPLVDPDTLELWRLATYRFHALVAHHWRSGRIFLAGDAAHQMPPFMAQGLCSGVRDAANLAWKLIGVLRDGWPAALLNTYEMERKPHIHHLVATTKELGEIIGELNVERALSRDARLGGELDEGRAETVRQKLIPDLSAGIIHMLDTGRSGKAAGSLLPQPVVCDARGREGLLDDFVDDRFCVLTRGTRSQNWLGEREISILRRLNARRVALTNDTAESTTPDVLILSENKGLLSRWLDEWECTCVVVRPDKVVYGVAADADALNHLIQVIAVELFDRPSAVDQAR